MTTIPMLEKELEQAYKDIKYYKNRIERLNNQLQKKENIIKEVREEIKKLANLYDDNYTITDKAKDILEILDKVGDEK